MMAYRPELTTPCVTVEFPGMDAESMASDHRSIPPPLPV